MNAVVTNLTLSSFYENGLHYSPPNFSLKNDSAKLNTDNVRLHFLLNNSTGRELGEMTQIGSVKKKVFVKEGKLPTREVRKKHHKDKDHHYHDHDHDHHHHEGHGHGHHHHDKACHHHQKHGKGGGDKHKKILLPIMFGLLTAKAIMLPLIIKGLALLSAKGLLLGLVATIMASILSLKKMIEPHHNIIHHEKKDDATRIEVLPLPVPESYHHHRSNSYAETTGEEEYHPYHGYY